MTDQTATPPSSAPLAAGLPTVQGRCPACGTADLFLGNGGYITCSLIGCPEPDAASTLLERRPTEPAGDRIALRDRIAAALAREDAHNAGYDHGFVASYGADDETDGFVDAVLVVLPASTDQTTALLPDWEAVYEPGNVSDYLIGYADDSVDTGPGIVVRRRLADETPTAEVTYPPAAARLPAGTLEADEIGANRLDAWARSPQGRNFLAHALVQLARTGWLRAQPGEPFEPMREDAQPDQPAAGARPTHTNTTHQTTKEPR